MITNLLFYLGLLSCFLLPILLYYLTKKRYSISFNKRGISRQLYDSIKYMSIIAAGWLLYLYFIVILFFTKLNIGFLKSSLLFILSIVLMATITRLVTNIASNRSQKKLIYLIDHSKHENSLELNKIFDVIRTFLYGIFSWVIIGIFVSGCLYLLIFSSITWIIAKHNNLNLIDIILFYKLPANLNYYPLNSLLIKIGVEPTPIIYPLGILYGFCCISVSYIHNQLNRNAERLFIVGVGIALGYYLTLYISGNILGIISSKLWQEKMLYFRLIYLILFYFICDGLKFSIRKRGMFKKKYEILLDGFYGLISTIILINGFEENVLSILTGPIFLICLFFAIGIVENTYGRYLFARSGTPHVLFEMRNKFRGKKFIDKLYILIHYYKQSGVEYNKIEDVDVTEIKDKREYITRKPALSIIMISFTFIAMSILFPIFIMNIYLLLKWVIIGAVGYTKHALKYLGVLPGFLQSAFSIDRS